MQSSNAQTDEKTCPIAAAAELVGDTWTILVVRDLSRGAKKFSDLAASLHGISTRTLSAKLHHLIEHGIITQKLYQAHPPRSLYALTKKGADLTALIQAMHDFGKRHLSRSRRK